LFSQASRRLTEWAPERWPVQNDWRPVIDAFLASEPGHQLGCFMRERLSSGAIIYPAHPFFALLLTALSQVKVVILGQDPYHGPGQAQGLAFSVPPAIRPPPSLRNIFKEIARDPDLEHRSTRPANEGTLVPWANQGVLLLNTCLTVEEGRPASHAKQGWESLTDAIVTAIAARGTPTVFLLWGAHAQAKQELIPAPGPMALSQAPCHLILTANHPSPLSALRPPTPFLGCGHFSRANAFLQAQGIQPVTW
jgi:uracil-DNA glycosylase